eukprot:6472949-Amphidinium_carterae.2
MMFNDEIDDDEKLREGVLYWKTIESIKQLRERARSGKDPEAKKQLDEYIDENDKLDLDMREEEEKARGAIEDLPDFQQAKADRNSEAVQEIVY